MDGQQSHDLAAPEDTQCPRCGGFTKNGRICLECKSVDYDEVVEYLRLKGEL
jgi:ribosomal protein L32